MDVFEKVATRGYWTVKIRPDVFVPDRVPYEDLEPVIARCSVQLRGWDVPHIDVHEPIRRFDDSIEQSSDWDHHVEVWRFYQSGQFLLRKGMRLAWRDQSVWFDDQRVPEGDIVGVSDAVGHFAEVFELAARLAVSPAGGDGLVVEANARNISGYRLWGDSPRRASLFDDYVTQMHSFEFPVHLERDELIAEKDELALTAAAEFLKRFGFTPSRDLLKGVRDEFGR